MGTLEENMKLVIANKKGQAKQVEVESASSLMGKKIGEKVSGDGLGLEGYEFEIRGGSDVSGFPMRRDVQGTGRKRILVVKGTGIHNKIKGNRVRKTVAGNTVSATTAQVNLFIVKAGKEDVFVEKKEGESAEGEAKPEEAPKEEKADEKKEETKPDKKEGAKPEEKKEAPKEEVKEEKKKEKKDEQKA
tara:strand:+ start:2979 stop:3545 length:567 start_codon:yes stop_codon:yes gene_type:complete